MLIQFFAMQWIGYRLAIGFDPLVWFVTSGSEVVIQIPMWTYSM